MTDPIMLTDQELDDLVAKLSNSLGIVFDTEPLEVFQKDYATDKVA